jgi:hypothetical protein
MVGRVCGCHASGDGNLSEEKSHMKTSKIIIDRIYGDYFLHSRMGEYKDLLYTLLQLGFEFHSIGTFWRLRGNPDRQMNGGKYIVLRHDIDSDVATAKQMWGIEKELGITSSYFFRLSTVDVPLMQEIDRSGSDTGYHYEELATYAKEHGVTTMSEITEHMEQIRARFRENLTDLRKRTGLALTIAASHGDFMNRKLRIINTEILKDRAFRSAMGIEMEAYDDDYRSTIEKLYSDDAYPTYWKPESPLMNSVLAYSKIQLLIHPGNWQSTIYAHTYHNIHRVFEEVKYQMIRANHLFSRRIKRTVSFR